MEKHLECMDHHEDVCSRIWISTNSTNMILLLTVRGMEAQNYLRSPLIYWHCGSSQKKHIYIYICMFLIKDIISIHSFVLTTTNSPPSTHLPTENNLPNLPTDCSKLLIFTNRLLSKTRSTFYDFSLKPSTHWESREPLNWVWKHLRMFWCQPFGSHAEQKGAIQKRKILRQ